MRTRLRLLTVAPLAAAGLLVMATPALADVSGDEAGQLVVDAYGGTVISVESDSEGGVDTWEVEVEGSSQGRIEVDVNKATGELVGCEPEDGEGSCLGDANGGGNGDNDSDDNAAGGAGTTGGTDGQVQPMPSGGAETGGGSTSGVEDTGLLVLGGAALLAAGGTVLGRRRVSQ